MHLLMRYSKCEKLGRIWEGKETFFVDRSSSYPSLEYLTAIYMADIEKISYYYMVSIKLRSN